MRPIKFRAKSAAVQKLPRLPRPWSYGGLMIDGEEAWLCVKTEWKGVIAIKADPGTVGQFTGLYDKNNTEIYEGDIILCKGKHIYSVEWVSDGFIMRGKLYGGVTSIKSFLPNEREIIGNIHDNPELVKGGEK